MNKSTYLEYFHMDTYFESREMQRKQNVKMERIVINFFEQR